MARSLRALQCPSCRGRDSSFVLGQATPPRSAPKSAEPAATRTGPNFSEGDELVLSRVEGSDRFFGNGRITARVGFVRLSSITASAGADIRSANELHLDEAVIKASAGSDLDLDVQAQRSLELDLSAGSDLDLTGKAPSLAIEASAGSDVDATSFEAERVNIRLSGGSDARVRATQAIEIEASGGSDVVVFGNPAQRDSHADRSSDVVWR